MTRTDPARAIFPESITPSADLRLSPGILSNGHLFVTGMTGSGTDGGMPEDPEVQFRAAFDKIAQVLAAAGLDFGDVVEITSYHVDIQRHFDTFAEVHGRFVRPPYPAWTAIGVAELRRPGALVEVKVTARQRS